MFGILENYFAISIRGGAIIVCKFNNSFWKINEFYGIINQYVVIFFNIHTVIQYKFIFHLWLYYLFLSYCIIFCWLYGTYELWVKFQVAKKEKVSIQIGPSLWWLIMYLIKSDNKAELIKSSIIFYRIVFEDFLLWFTNFLRGV